MQARNDWDNFAPVIRNHIHRVFGELAAVSDDQPVSPDHPEDDLIAWLSELCLLSNVPFHYLIPSVSMLPSNSIRLFYVNPNWQLALVDGACSLGRNATINISHDQELIDAVFARIRKRVKAVRPLLQRKPVSTEDLQEGVEMIGGFILRSPVVRGWRGLEFKAHSSTGNPLRALRIETLSDDVLIGLFDGVPYTVEIAQPPEGFYFGFNRSNGQLWKRLRSFETGELLSDKDVIDVAVQSENRRTIDVCQTAKHIATHFQKEVTSAEFALQMIRTPYVGRVIRTDSQ